MEYSDYAIVLKWQILNDEQDIGNWEMLFEEDKSRVFGNGMNELIEALSQLREDIINVIFVKNLNLFEVIGECYFSFALGYKAVIKDGNFSFFQLKILNNIELRNWDNWEEDVDDCDEFLRRLNLYRNNFKGRAVNKLNLKNHLNYTKARDMFMDLVESYYLKSPWCKTFKEELLPKDEDELYLYTKVNKASFYFMNPKYVNKVVENVIGYDISSSHSGFILRKKYPLRGAKQCTSRKEIHKIIEDGFYAWIGEFEFIGLKEKIDLPIDLRSFGYINSDDNWVLRLTNAHWSAFKRLFTAENMIPMKFRYFEQKELDRNYAKMINTIYLEKEHFKKNDDSFVKGIFKFRTELPFGQSIKSPVAFQEVIYDEEENCFIKSKIEEQSFEDTVKKISKYAIPMHVGIWTAAYSWAEEVNMILDLGFENVVYGDTDCVKFVGEKGIKVIEAHNKEIDKETNSISSKRNMLETSKKLGRWQYEGTFNRFKAIGVKWYLFDENGKISVKAAGAIIPVLLAHLAKTENPFEEFSKEMYVEGLFKNICINRITHTVSVGYNNYMGDKLIRELKDKTNGFFI